MPSIFSRIVAGEIPCHKVWEDEHHLAFLDIRPVAPGHTLVIPKREVDYLFDLSPAEYGALWEAVRRVEAKIQARMGCERVIVTVMGWEVPHVHVHLVPTDNPGQFPLPAPCGMDKDAIAALAARFQDAPRPQAEPVLERTIDEAVEDE
ncbi:MAG: HIT family protein [Myxococcota bacterium]|nr:HIT family protein [Myxococcota bacterium]